MTNSNFLCFGERENHPLERFKGESTYLLRQCILGVDFGKLLGVVFWVRVLGEGADQNCRTVFENSVSRPVFHR